jgi:phospholipid/cholesterol/gamma-HCH transport system substrate-binding protein
MSQPTKPQGPLPVRQISSWDRVKLQVYALILIVLIVMLGVLAAAAYNKAFIPAIPVTLQSDRAGLQMHPNNRVKIRGVDIGRVESVRENDTHSGVLIELALDPTLTKQVPSNVTVSLEQLTAFGNKAVQMNYPANPSGQFLHAGSVITADHVSVEVNSTFDQLMRLLTELQPAKLNAVTGAFAETLQNNGDSLGSTIVVANDYLKKFNAHLPNLQRDFHVAAGFSQVYADAAPDIVDLLRNAGVTSQSVSDRSVDFPGLLHTLHGTGNEIDGFFGENANPLTDMLSSLRPFTSLLQEYSPQFTCLLDGAAITYDDQMKIWTPSGANFEINLVNPGATQTYQYPQDLPKIGPGPQKGPNCRGLPLVTNSEDSLADYTADPQRLNQKQPDNSPQLGPTQIPGTGMTPLAQFFGPSVYAPMTKPMTKVGGR